MLAAKNNPIHALRIENSLHTAAAIAAGSDNMWLEQDEPPMNDQSSSGTFFALL